MSSHRAHRQGLLAAQRTEPRYQDTWTARATRDTHDMRQLAADLILHRDGHHCYLCHKPLTTSTTVIEHIIPISKGGENTAANVGASCLHCNSAKGDKAVSIDVTSGRPVYHRIRT